jgi:hypothetical protein
MKQARPKPQKREKPGLEALEGRLCAKLPTLKGEIRACFYDTPEDATNANARWEIEVWKEILRQGGLNDASEDDAIAVLVYNPTDLDTETQTYIANRWSRLAGTNRLYFHERRGFTSVINRLKALLRHNGLSAKQAEDLIAEALGLSSADTLRKRLQRHRLRKLG